MVDRNLIQQLGFTDEQLDQQVNDLYSSEHDEMLGKVLDKKIQALVPGTIVTGMIIGLAGNDVILELGLKSEGMVEASEFDNPEDIVSAI